MRIYRVNERISLHVQPGTEFKEPAEFFDKDGHAILFTVQFEKNRAEVSDALGRFLIDKKLAYRSLTAARDAVQVIEVA